MNALAAGIGGAACLTVALVSTSGAQEKPSEPRKVEPFRMEIYNGPVRTVHYFSAGASKAEQSELREVERSENEASLADQLLDLRRQYVSNERFLENRRREVQHLNYGYYSTNNYGYYSPYAYYGNFWNGNPYWPGLGSGTVSQGLFGVGDEGVIKTEIAKTLAAHRQGLTPVQQSPGPRRGTE